MKRALEKLIEAFEPVFESQFLKACLKNLILVFVLFSFILFLVSRIPALWARIIILSLSTIGAYGAITLTFGALARAVYMKYVRQKEPDLGLCLDFAIFHLPTYIAIPAIFAILGGCVKAGTAIIFFLGTNPTVGIVIMGLLFTPLVIAGSVFGFMFTVSSFFTPAVVATEEKGLLSTCSVFIQLARNKTLQLLVYFLLGLCVTLIFTVALTAMLLITLPATLRLASFILEASFDKLFISAAGYLLYSPDVLIMKNVSLSFHLAGLFLYLTTGIVAAAAVTPPSVYFCAVSTLLYQEIRDTGTVSRKDNFGIPSNYFPENDKSNRYQTGKNDMIQKQ